MSRSMGPSINDVTALGGWGIKDFVTAALKSMTMGGGRGCQNFSKLRDIIYGRPLCVIHFIQQHLAPDILPSLLVGLLLPLFNQHFRSEGENVKYLQSMVP
jgi:hypothetical protein